MNIPAKLRECFHSRKTRHFKHQGQAEDFAAGMTGWREPLSGALALERALEKIAAHPLVVEAAARVREKSVQRESKTVAEAVGEILEIKEKTVGIRANSLSSLKCSLNSFAEFSGGDKPLASITAKGIEDWMADGGLMQRTRKGRLTDLKTMLNLCVRRGMLDKSPADGVDVPIVPFKPAELCPVDDIEKLLRQCEKTDPALIGYIALILFGGLRSKESKRALPENIRNGMIDLDDGAQTKLKSRRCEPVRPVLAAWLAVDGVEIGGKNIYSRFVTVQRLAGVKIPDNGLRHTSASCWLRLIGAREAAKMLGHSEATLNAHYANNVSPEDAQRFEALRPTPNHTPT